MGFINREERSVTTTIAISNVPEVLVIEVHQRDKQPPVVSFEHDGNIFARCSPANFATFVSDLVKVGQLVQRFCREGETNAPRRLTHDERDD